MTLLPPETPRNGRDPNSCWRGVRGRAGFRGLQSPGLLRKIAGTGLPGDEGQKPKVPDCRSGAGLSVRGGEEKPSDPRKESRRGVTARITSPSACAVHRIHLPSNTTVYSAEVSSQTKKEQKKYFLEKVRVRNHGEKA